MAKNLRFSFYILQLPAVPLPAESLGRVAQPPCASSVLACEVGMPMVPSPQDGCRGSVSRWERSSSEWAPYRRPSPSPLRQGEARGLCLLTVLVVSLGVLSSRCLCRVRLLLGSAGRSGRHPPSHLTREGAIHACPTITRYPWAWCLPPAHIGGLLPGHLP